MQMHFMLSGASYDFLKKVAQIYLPALGTLYYALAQIWHLPRVEEINGTILAIDTFLGLVLGLSSSTYHASDEKYDGVVNIVDNPDTGKKMYTLEVKGDPEEIDTKKQITFKVVGG